MSGAVPPPAARPLERAARVPPTYVLSRVRSCAGVGTRHRPHSVPACSRGRRCSSVGVVEGPSPWGVAFHRCGGRLVSGAVPTGRPSSGAGSQGSATRVSGCGLVRACWGQRRPMCCVRGCVGVGAQHCPLGLHALWGLRAAGVAGGLSPGGVAWHCCEGRPGVRRCPSP